MAYEEPESEYHSSYSKFNPGQIRVDECHRRLNKKTFIAKTCWHNLSILSSLNLTSPFDQLAH